MAQSASRCNRFCGLPPTGKGILDDLDRTHGVDKRDINAHVGQAARRLPFQKGHGGEGNAVRLPSKNPFGRTIMAYCFFHFDKDDFVAAAKNPVDLSARTAPAPFQTGHPLGNQMPDRDLLVSGDHRVMVSGPGFEELLLDADEVLVPAKLLLGRDGVSVDEADAVIYYHLMFDETELLLSEGIWTESTQPVTGSLAGPDAEAIDELHRLFPELKLAAAAPKTSRLTLDPVLAGMFGFTGATLLTTRPA